MVAMKSILNKDIIRDIKKSKGRFLSIMCIIALGVAFYSGIKISPMVMKDTSDSYYDEYNLMDIKLLSTLGLTDKDVDEVKKIENIEGVFPTYSVDVITKYKSQEQVSKIHALPLDDIKENNKNYINKVKVVQGRLPQKSGECVIEKSKVDKLDVALGSKINLSSGNDEKLSDTLKNTQYTVVGKIETPYYLSYEKGSSSIGDGTISSVIMIPQDDFKMDSYSEIFLTLDNTKKENSYTQKYFDKVDKVTNEIEKISDSRIKARYDEVIKKANEELDKGKNQYEEKKNEANNELNKAQDNINKFTNEIKSGELKLRENENKAIDEIEKGKIKISNGEKQLQEGYKQYQSGKTDFEENKKISTTAISDAKTKLDSLTNQINDLNKKSIYIEDKIKEENLSAEEKEQLNKELNQNKTLINSMNLAYEQGNSQLSGKINELQNIESKLNNTKNTLDKNKEKLATQKSNLNSMEIKSKNEFKKAKNNIKTQKQKIEKAKIELKDAKTKAKDELSKAEKKIKDSEDKISKIEKPKWYILDRKSHYSYVQYEGNANSIDALSKIFPVFFFSVAALVCLTTMTRMVDEQRINIGTLKALGYTTRNIAKKYIMYALSASLLGSIIGLAVGLTVFPIVVFKSYGIMYTLPEIKLLFDIPLALGVTFTAISITTIAAYLACYKELKETPSVLMRPKAPKNGKRILLERMPFIWNKVGFIGKVTIRNIFRYKKRFLMTVLGISGCTALILSGLGIQDSIQMIVDGQYKSIFKYNMTVTIDNNASPSELGKIEKYVDDEKLIDNYLLMNNENGKIVKNNKEEELTIAVPKDSDKMKKVIGLRDRKTQNNIDLTKTGIVLSEKVSRDLDVKIGDNIEVVNSKDKKAKVKVDAITENYVGHYAYMSKECYKELFKRDSRYNRIIGTLKDESVKAEDNISKNLTDIEKVSGVGFSTGVKENFEKTIKSLNYVVLIMTLSAGALAFVVLYNLTNVNISERIREIATIKVLGFYDNEVSAYIYRENIILTVVGTIVGLGIGKLLHQFIMVTVEIDNMMFGRIIDASSYIIAAVLTIILGFIVNFAMYYKLKNIQMVESLKSVD